MLCSLFGWAVFGLFVGAIARLIWPHRQSIGLIRTMLLGVAGSVVGGWVTMALRGDDPSARGLLKRAAARRMLLFYRGGRTKSCLPMVADTNPTRERVFFVRFPRWRVGLVADARAGRWRHDVDASPALKNAMMADYVVLGGGSVKKIDQLPDGTRRGHNRTVVEGGRRLFEELPDPAEKNSGQWLVI